MTPNAPRPLHVVILAAGEGKRMKSDRPKVLQAIAGKPMLGHVVDAAQGRPRLDRQHLLRFVLAWLALTALSTLLVAQVAGRIDLHAAWLAKPAVEAALAVLGFVVWRQWVFR